VTIDLEIATSHRELFQSDPLGQVWLPRGSERRIRIAQLEGNGSRQ
jgi:hypothetical protein